MEFEHENRIVLGLDYGTTRTGMSYMMTTALNKPGLEDLELFTQWRDGGGNPKIPSEHSYSTVFRSDGQGGRDAKPHKLVLHWTKLELEARPPVVELESLRDAVEGLRLIRRLREDLNPELQHNTPRHLTKGPVDIVGDFLLIVSRQYYNSMRERSAALTQGKVPLDMAITHPAEWDYLALNKLYRAVMQGFPKRMFPTRRNVFFVPEPEACALFTIQQLLASEENDLIPGECCVICDAGGGTVDLATYRIDSVDPLRMSRVGIIIGGNYGATSIDRAFLRWVRSITTNPNMIDEETGAGGHFLLTPERKTLLARFDPFKHQFTGDETNMLTLAKSMRVKDGTPEFSNGLLTIDPDKMKEFFRESVEGTIKLIAKQIAAATVLRETVTKIFMSGGLSQSEYLFKRVEDWAMQAPGDMPLEVTRPQDCWTAVTQGSVLCITGLGARAPPPVVECPRHYGISGSENWNRWRHGSQSTPINDEIHGQAMALGQIAWIVRKGDVIIPGKPMKVTLPVTCTFKPINLGCNSTARIKFCATIIDNPSTRLSELPEDSNEMSVLEIKLDDVPESCRQTRVSIQTPSYIVAQLDVVIRVDETGVTAKALCGTKEMAEYRTSL